METKSLGNCSGGYGETDAKYTVFRSKFGKPAILDNADSNIPLSSFIAVLHIPLSSYLPKALQEKLLKWQNWQSICFFIAI